MDVDDILSKYSDSDDKKVSETQQQEFKEEPQEGEKKEFIRRKPSVWKLVNDITKEDTRVRVVGIVTELDKDSGIINIDDGKNISIISTPEQVKDLRVGQKISVIGIVVPFSDNIELRAEIVQDFDSIDMVLYKKFMEFMRSKQ